jgi:hypothetical protein
MANDSVNIEKHIKTYFRNTRVFNVNPGNQGSPIIFFLGVWWDWVHLRGRPLFRQLYQPRMIDDDECETVGGMRIGKGNRSSRRKPAPVPLYPPQILHYLMCDWTRAAGVGSRRLTALAVTRPNLLDLTALRYERNSILVWYMSLTHPDVLLKVASGGLRQRVVHF